MKTIYVYVGPFRVRFRGKDWTGYNFIEARRQRRRRSKKRRAA